MEVPDFAQIARLRQESQRVFIPYASGSNRGLTLVLDVGQAADGESGREKVKQKE